MARKISKHSRAARRGEIDTENEAKSLESLPSAENSDVRKSIIRTTIKNENLLAKKMELDKIKKKGTKRKTSLLKHKAERNDRVEGVLATKIQQSIDRAKYVQDARKSDWDRINQNIRIQNEIRIRENKPELTEKEREQAEEDAYVKSFYMDMDKDTENTEEPEQKEEQQKKPNDGNRYALLDEAEA